MAREPKETIVDNVITALDALSFDELSQVLRRANELSDSKKAEAKQAFLVEIQDRAKALGLTVGEANAYGLGYAAPTKRAPSSPATKLVTHRDEHGNTYGGKGPRPRWLKEAIEAGKTMDDFKI